MLMCTQELGYNAIHYNQLAHSWLKDVRVVNSDSAFYSWGMIFCTITGEQHMTSRHSGTPL